MSFLRRRPNHFVTRDKLLAGIWEKRYSAGVSLHVLCTLHRRVHSTVISDSRPPPPPPPPSPPPPPLPLCFTLLPSLSSYSDSVPRWQAVSSSLASEREMNFMENGQHYFSVYACAASSRLLAATAAHHKQYETRRYVSNGECMCDERVVFYIILRVCA